MIGKRFMELTYILEGDGLCVLMAYDRIRALLGSRAHLQDNMHTVKAHVRTFCLPASIHDAVLAGLNLEYAVAVVSPGFDYLEARIGDEADLAPSWRVLKAVRIFDPSTVSIDADIDLEFFFNTLPFLKEIRVELVGELLEYRTQADGIQIVQAADGYTERIVEFWAARRESLPTWCFAARQVFALVPSSAAAERVFSQMRLMFGDRQDSMLQDIFQTSLMLRVNKRV